MMQDQQPIETQASTETQELIQEQPVQQEHIQAEAKEENEEEQQPEVTIKTVDSADSSQKKRDEEVPAEIMMDPSTVRPPSGTDKIKVWKQRMFHKGTQDPEDVIELRKKMASLKKKLQQAQSELMRSIKIAESVRKAADSYTKTTEQSHVELDKAMQTMLSTVAIGSKLTVFKDSLSNVKKLENDLDTLAHYRHAMDRYRRKSVNCDTESKAWEKRTSQRQTAQNNYKVYSDKVKKDIQELLQETQVRHKFSHDILAAEFQLLHCLRSAIEELPTPEGKKLYQKAWKSFSKRMYKIC